MQLRRISQWAIALLAIAALTGSCQTTSGKEPAQESSGGGEFSSGDSGLGGSGGLSSSEMSGAKVADLGTIYFDYDRATLRDDQKPTLHQDAAVIRGTDAWRQVVVEGHCDERGSEEYNLALGERRANSVKQYLIDSGVPASRLDTVSFGESKPAVQGHDESAWKWNRRAAFRVVH